MIKEQLIKKINDKSIKVGVVGLGYVGLPLAVEKAKAGFETIGFDVQAAKVDMVNSGHNYIGDVVDEDLKKLVDEGMLKATTDFSFVKDVDFVAICVPTPLDEHQQPDISYVKNSTIEISKYMTKGTMVVLESTTYPGTTEELIKPILEEGSGRDSVKCLLVERLVLPVPPEGMGRILYDLGHLVKKPCGFGVAADCHLQHQLVHEVVYDAVFPEPVGLDSFIPGFYQTVTFPGTEKAVLDESI